MTSVSAEEIPEFFYKYRSLADEQQRGWLKQILVEHQFFWAAPSSFNDPFDCAPICLAPTGRTLKEITRRALRTNTPQANRKARKVRERELRRRPQAMQVRLDRMVPELMEETAVYSLATRPDQVLMWSHYASAHQGVCLRFDPKILINHFLIPVSKAIGLFPVSYQRERPIVRIGTEEKEALVEKLLLTKADFWSYEEEWRFIGYRARAGLRSFPAKALTAIVLGARTSPEDEALVRQWSEKTGVELQRARTSSKDFRLEIGPA